ncbi:hypothetical protein J7E62_22710 [Variovorax paradoxus]|nr:hypothetical protein [Variovorax paradoxus]
MNHPARVASQYAFISATVVESTPGEFRCLLHDATGSAWVLRQSSAQIFESRSNAMVAGLSALDRLIHGSDEASVPIAHCGPAKNAPLIAQPSASAQPPGPARH